VQAHRERVRGFVEKREKEEEEETGSGGGCGLERERQGVVRGLVWGHTVWRGQRYGMSREGEEVRRAEV